MRSLQACLDSIPYAVWLGMTAEPDSALRMRLTGEEKHVGNPVLNVWDQMPHVVCLGGQKNFVAFTQRMRESRPRTWRPDDVYFRDLIAKAIVCNATSRIVKQDLDGYRSQIAAYVVSRSRTGPATCSISAASGPGRPFHLSSTR